MSVCSEAPQREAGGYFSAFPCACSKWHLFSVKFSGNHLLLSCTDLVLRHGPSKETPAFLHETSVVSQKKSKVVASTRTNLMRVMARLTARALDFEQG